MAAAQTALAPAVASSRGATYERHRPEDTVLYQGQRSRVLPKGRRDLPHRLGVPNLAPCVPDSTGTLRCLGTTPNDGGIVCLSAGGKCTATGDCCTGLVCNISPGAGSGTCGTQPGATDGGTPMCALYGQGCNGSVNCCNNVPCVYSVDGTACNGRTGCTCYDPNIIP